MNPVGDVVLEEMARTVSLKEGGNEIELEAIRAVIRAATVGAIKGNSRQQKLVLEYATAAQEAKRAELQELIQSVEEYKARFEPMFQQARARGGPEPTQVPHPDHVDIDPLTLELVFTGPITLEAKKAWDHLKWQLRQTEEGLEEARCEVRANRRGRHHKEMVKLHEEHMQRLEENVPPGWNWREELGWEEAYAERMHEKLNLLVRKSQERRRAGGHA